MPSSSGSCSDAGLSLSGCFCELSRHLSPFLLPRTPLFTLCPLRQTAASEILLTHSLLVGVPSPCLTVLLGGILARWFSLLWHTLNSQKSSGSTGFSSTLENLFRVNLSILIFFKNWEIYHTEKNHIQWICTIQRCKNNNEIDTHIYTSRCSLRKENDAKSSFIYLQDEKT